MNVAAKRLPPRVNLPGKVSPIQVVEVYGLGPKGDKGDQGLVEEAPLDGVTYGRNSAKWVGLIKDAPDDGMVYGRSEREWVPVELGIDVIDGGEF